MAVPACLRLADDVFPRVRALAAHRLREAGWSQVRIGQALGLSQAMVSKHLSAAPPTDPLAAHLAAEFAEDLLHPTPASGPSAWCSTLTVGQDRPGGPQALTDLLEAEAHLRRQPPLRLMPQVGLNLARALSGATSPGDVLAFPGRLIEANGRLLRPAPPAFGGSTHLAGLLLASGQAAAANVRGGPDVAAACRRLGWKPIAVERNGRSNGNPDAPILRALQAKPGAMHVLDPGAIGLEPCLYLFGPDAASLARSILRLNDTLVNP